VISFKAAHLNNILEEIVNTLVNEGDLPLPWIKEHCKIKIT
jgi:hypothetical protein